MGDGSEGGWYLLRVHVNNCVRQGCECCDMFYCTSGAVVAHVPRCGRQTEATAASAAREEAPRPQHSANPTLPSPLTAPHFPPRPPPVSTALPALFHRLRGRPSPCNIIQLLFGTTPLFPSPCRGLLPTRAFPLPFPGTTWRTPRHIHKHCPFHHTLLRRPWKNIPRSTPTLFSPWTTAPAWS